MNGAGAATARRKAARGLFAYALLYLAFLYIPVLFLPLFSFNNSRFIAFPLTGFTTKWYAQMLADTAMQRALWNSLKVGTAAALISTMLGLLAARAVTRYRLPGGAAVLGFASLPLFIPDIVLGISLLLADEHHALPLSLVHRAGRPCADLHALCHHRADLALRRLRPQPGGGLARSGRDRLDDVLARDLPAGAAGHRLQPAADLPRLVRRVPDRLFPGRHRATLPIYIWGQLRFPYKLPAVLALGALILMATTALVVLAEWVRGLGLAREQRRVGA